MYIRIILNHSNRKLRDKMTSGTIKEVACIRSLPYGPHLWICMSLFKDERQQRVLLIHNDGALSQSVILLCVFPADLNPTEERSVNA